MSVFNSFYRVIKPSKTGDFHDEWKECLLQLDSISHSKYAILRLNVFVDVTNADDMLQKKQHIGNSLKKLFKDSYPPYTVSGHTPEPPYQVCFEVLCTKSDKSITYKRAGDISYIVFEMDKWKEIWCAGLGDYRMLTNIEKASIASFEKLQEILQSENMTFDHIVRQWNFISDILLKEPRDSETIQYYQVFNEIRYEYYSRNKNIMSYPAATGIGTKFSGVIIDCYAIMSDQTIQAIPIKNPIQKNPYTYGQRVLIGSSLQEKQKKHPPLFERALLLTKKDASRLFISGTASIKGQKNVEIGDIEKQTHVTLENIEKLVCRENLQDQYKNLEVFPDKYAYARVYVKYISDIPKVKSICESFFRNIPIIYLQADVCRDDLLVEIEAEKFY